MICLATFFGHIAMQTTPRFSPRELALLLEVPGIGRTVVQRIEEVGFGSFEKLRSATAAEIVDTISDAMNSTCWRNSPQARNAVHSAISVAKEGCDL